MAHCDVALAASGTVTVEAALLGAPMVTFYKVTGLSWAIGKLLVDVPFYSMVNLIAGKKVVPELMQDEMTGERLAAEAARPVGQCGRTSENEGRTGARGGGSFPNGSRAGRRRCHPESSRRSGTRVGGNTTVRKTGLLVTCLAAAAFAQRGGEDKASRIDVDNYTIDVTDQSRHADADRARRRALHCRSTIRSQAPPSNSTTP